MLGRLTWWMSICLCVLYATMFVNIWFRRFPPRNLFDSLWLTFAFLCVQIALSLAFRFRICFIRRRAVEWGGLLCKHCGYDLRSTPEPGPCPECGKTFTDQGLKDYWMREWRR